MSGELLAQLSDLESHASPMPWRVVHLDDDHCMSLVAITNSDAPMGNAEGCSWEGAHILAATLVQQPSYVVPDDQRWDENAALIVAVRNALPELLRLAHVGLAAEAPA